MGFYEKKGSRHYVDSIESREFRKFFGNAGLIKLGYSGSRFTWCNIRMGAARVWERIDRVLATTDWLQRFSGYQVQYLSRMASNYCPILISTDGPYLFKPPIWFEKF